MTVARQLVGVGLLLAVVLSTRVLSAHASLNVAADATMALGFVLVVSYAAGRVVSKVGLPSITGYLAVGILFGPHVLPPIFSGLTVMRAQTVESLQLLDGAALGLIALTAGGELKLSTVRQKARSLLWIIGSHVVLVTVLTAAVMFGLFWSFDVLPTRSPLIIAVAAVMLGVTAVAKSPATTIAVIQEYSAKGPATDIVLAVTVAKDIVVVTLFTIGLAAAVTVLHPEQASISNMFAVLGWEVLGSLMLGISAGWVLAKYAQWVGSEMPLLVLAIAFVSGGLMEAYHLSGLLVCMVAGFYVENFSDHGADLIHAVEEHSLPLYIIFFTMAGAALDVEALGSTWGVALTLVLARTAFTFLATWIGAKIAKEPAVVRRYAWTGFIGQAGVTLGFASILATELPQVGESLRTIVVAAVAMNQIVGPVVFRLGLRAAKEV